MVTFIAIIFRLLLIHLFFDTLEDTEKIGEEAAVLIPSDGCQECLL